MGERSGREEAWSGWDGRGLGGRGVAKRRRVPPPGGQPVRAVPPSGALISAHLRSAPQPQLGDTKPCHSAPRADPLSPPVASTVLLCPGTAPTEDTCPPGA